MIVERLPVWVTVDRRRSDNPWQAERWVPVAVKIGAPQVEPWTVLAEGPGWTRYYAGSFQLALFRSDTANYKFNLEGAAPAVHVVLRPGGPAGMTLLAVTVDPGEIDSHADSGSDLIEALPLPAELADWMRTFVVRHHQDKPRYKRRRDRADPEALARRPAEAPHG